MPDMTKQDAARAVLAWYADMGVDEAVGESPANFFAWTAPPPSTPAGRISAAAPAPAPKRTAAPVVPISPAPMIAADEAIKHAEQAARAAASFEALAAAVAAFEGCPLKAGARMTVFSDGVPGSDLLVIGEAPGREEDMQGKPFVGRAGQLLDRMLAAIDRSRKTNTLISNVIYWRPPGNRTPTPVEMAICRPFVERLIELTEPKAVMLAGGAAMQAMLGVSGIMRARGIWREIETASGFKVPALPVFHPAFLLRSPAQKRHAWADLLALEARLKATG